MQKIQGQYLNWQSHQAVRDRLMVVLRLVQLMRSIDLARTLRCTASEGGLHYFLVQRKGSNHFAWESFVELEDPSISPWHLAQRYVAQTSHQVKPGGFFVSQLCAPLPPPLLQHHRKHHQKTAPGTGSAYSVVWTSLHQGGQGSPCTKT